MSEQDTLVEQESQDMQVQLVLSHIFLYDETISTFGLFEHMKCKGLILHQNNDKFPLSPHINGFSLNSYSLLRCSSEQCSSIWS